MNKIVETLKKILNNVQDDTSKYNDIEKSEGKILSIFCYFGFLVLFVYYYEKDNRYVLFHLKEGLKLFIFEVLGIIIIKVCEFIYLDILLKPLYYFIIIYLSLIGIINVINDKAKELPFLNFLHV